MKKHTTLSPSSYLDDLNGAVRENPVAAGAIGLGILWMFFGGKRFPALAASAAGMAGGAVTAGARGLRDGAVATSSVVSETAGRVYSEIEGAAKKAGEAFQTDTKDDAQQSGQSGYYDMASEQSGHWSRLGTSVREHASAAFERQPLLLGAIGLAAGAAIAATFKPTEKEQSLMGESAGSFKARAAGLVDDAVDLAKSRTSSALKVMAEEATAQGFTATNVKDRLMATADKLKSAAKATSVGNEGARNENFKKSSSSQPL